jgi:autophagy-related protein 9
MTSHRLFPNQPERELCTASDLDRFLHSLYDYYTTRGYLAMFLSEGCALLSFLFTIGFSIFLIAWVDWESLALCQDEHTCHSSAMVENVHQHKTFWGKNPFHSTPSLWTTLIAWYLLLFLALWLFRCWTAFKRLKSAYQSHQFMTSVLGISDDELPETPWHNVVDRIIILHEQGALFPVLPLIVPPELAVQMSFSHWEVALRLMRKENYIIALNNHQELRFLHSSITGTSMTLSKSLEWSFSICLFPHMFSEDLEISQDFFNDVEGLQTRFRTLGVVMLLLIPFTFVYMLFYFFFQNAQQFYSSKAFLGPRQWTQYAHWKLREYNELPHFFHGRLQRAYGPAAEYLQSFAHVHLNIVGQFVSFVSGSICVALLLVSIVSDAALLYVHVFGVSLLYALGAMSAVFAASRTFLTDENKHVEREKLLESFCMQSHLSLTDIFPDTINQERETKIKSIHSGMYEKLQREEERKRAMAGARQTKNEIETLLQYKVQVFLEEIMGVMSTPLVLIFSLPNSALEILSFLRSVQATSIRVHYKVSIDS